MLQKYIGSVSTRKVNLRAGDGYTLKSRSVCVHVSIKQIKYYKWC